MRRSIFKYPLIIFLLLSFLVGQIPGEKFEVVESIPSETNFDNPQIRNTTKVWLEMINSAQKTIDIEQFYIANKENSDLEKVI
ncbi:MAG TPA: hypothetical protein VKP78_05215 [bacterium]|nr:hypothetical protein [bacterium]